MSHVALVELEIKDLQAAAEAAKRCGCELVLGQKTWKWWGSWQNDFAAQNAAYLNGIDPKRYGTCEHAIRVPGCEWEVGLMRNAKGQLVPVFDGYGDRGEKIQKALGQNLANFKVEYGVAVATKAATRQGYQVNRTVNKATGRVQLVCQR